MKNDIQRYVVADTCTEAPGIVTLSLTQNDNTVPSCAPGQFINVFFPETKTPEGKAYSISSAPNKKTLSITVRGIGEFSNRLCAMGPGDTVRASLPYGFFRPEREDSDVVMLAAGIGITPFRSIIHTAAQYRSKRRMTLLHTVRTAPDAIFRKEFETLRRQFPGLALSYFVTRQTETPSYATPRRMNADDVLPHIGTMANTEFLLCGSIPFTRDMWRALKQKGIPADAIYTEAFFSH